MKLFLATVVLFISAASAIDNNEGVRRLYAMHIMVCISFFTFSHTNHSSLVPRPLQLQQYLDRQLKSGKAKAFKPEDIDEKHRLAKASGKGEKTVGEKTVDRRLSKSGKGGIAPPKAFSPDTIDDVDELGERRLSKSSKSKSGKGRRLSGKSSSKSGKGRRLSKSSKSKSGKGRRLSKSGSGSSKSGKARDLRL